MESSITNNFAKSGQAMADKAADRVQTGIRNAQDTAKDAGNALSGKIDELRTEAGPALNKASDRARSTARQGWDSITDTARQARDVTSNAADSIVLCSSAIAGGCRVRATYTRSWFPAPSR